MILLSFSPSSVTTWRPLGFCWIKKQLHLKAISFLIAERLHSCCLAAGFHLVPGIWELMCQAGSQPCPNVPQSRAGSLLSLTLPRCFSYLKVHLPVQLHRCVAREVKQYCGLFLPLHKLAVGSWSSSCESLD